MSVFCVLECFATAVATVSGKNVSLEKQECFATAVATFFRPASKEGKGAPTQRGSGSVEGEMLYHTLSLTTKGVKERAILISYSLPSTSADSPSCRGRLLPPFICANLIGIEYPKLPPLGGITASADDRRKPVTAQSFSVKRK